MRCRSRPANRARYRWRKELSEYPRRGCGRFRKSISRAGTTRAPPRRDGNDDDVRPRQRHHEKSGSEDLVYPAVERVGEGRRAPAGQQRVPRAVKDDERGSERADEHHEADGEAGAVEYGLLDRETCGLDRAAGMASPSTCEMVSEVVAADATTSGRERPKARAGGFSPGETERRGKRSAVFALTTGRARASRRAGATPDARARGVGTRESSRRERGSPPPPSWCPRAPGLIRPPGGARRAAW